MRLGTFHRGGYPAFELLEVPGRSLIKIHVGNTIDDLKGCISPGCALGWVKNKWAVVSSRTALEGFMAAMGNITESTILIRSKI